MERSQSDCNRYLRDLDKLKNGDCGPMKFGVGDTYDSSIARRSRSPGATPVQSRTRNLGNRNRNKIRLVVDHVRGERILAEMSEDNGWLYDNWASGRNQENCG